MMNIKYCLLLTVFCIIYSFNYSTADCDGKIHDLILGDGVPGQRMLDTIREKTGKSFLKKQVREIQWPQGKKNNVTITKIEVLDQIGDGKGGCAYLVEGGVRNTFVKLRMKSQRGKKLDFLIKIYGK